MIDHLGISVTESRAIESVLPRRARAAGDRRGHGGHQGREAVRRADFTGFGSNGKPYFWIGEGTVGSRHAPRLRRADAQASG